MVIYEQGHSNKYFQIYCASVLILFASVIILCVSVLILFASVIIYCVSVLILFVSVIIYCVSVLILFVSGHNFLRRLYNQLICFAFKKMILKNIFLTCVKKIGNKMTNYTEKNYAIRKNVKFCSKNYVDSHISHKISL